MYSSATHFVFTLGDGVQGFTLDESIGEFILTHPNIMVPPRGKIYSVNEANRPQWDAPFTVCDVSPVEAFVLAFMFAEVGLFSCLLHFY